MKSPKQNILSCSINKLYKLAVKSQEWEDLSSHKWMTISKYTINDYF